MEVRISLASAVVIQWVSASGSDWFMEWRRGISGAVETQPATVCLIVPLVTAPSRSHKYSKVEKASDLTLHG
jgi:hypothetical protein